MVCVIRFTQIFENRFKIEDYSLCVRVCVRMLFLRKVITLRQKEMDFDIDLLIWFGSSSRLIHLSIEIESNEIG